MINCQLSDTDLYKSTSQYNTVISSPYILHYSIPLLSKVDCFGEKIIIVLYKVNKFAHNTLSFLQ